MQIKCKLKEILNKRKLSYGKFSEMSMVNVVTINNYCNSYSIPNLYTAYLIADALDLKVTDIWEATK